MGDDVVVGRDAVGCVVDDGALVPKAGTVAGAIVVVGYSDGEGALEYVSESKSFLA